MTDIPAIQRQLKIKTGVIERLIKENQNYRKEAEDNQQKLEKLISDNAEEWDIKNARKMIDETNKMIDDSAARLSRYVDEMKVLIKDAKKQLLDDPLLLKAEATIAPWPDAEGAEEVSA